LFPAFKPHEIPLLPTRYFLKMRAYLLEVREAERRSLGDDSAEPGYEVIDYDKDVLAKS
jgi:hypothetical protein